MNGYDVSFVAFKNGKPEGPLEPFLTGFAVDGKVLGRPRALTRAKDGSLLVVDDAAGTVWRVAPSS